MKILLNCLLYITQRLHLRMGGTVSEGTKMIYTHEEMIKLCDEARDQGYDWKKLDYPE